MKKSACLNIVLGWASILQKLLGLVGFIKHVENFLVFEIDRTNLRIIVT